MPDNEHTFRCTITMGAGLSREFDEIVGTDEAARTAALRKAILLYVAAKRAANSGAKVGVAEPGQALATEFINI
ncbi:hypothetical protein [Pelomonas cellulosilytica]|uniref:Transcriptional regulator n=1 Tax=Pelomonas cellulosilytica TaxID=2906762 RepID=A0ABS8XWB5_9BURK|nr:hypothetical protein [Pelomonas sp. P8]MCE4555580.1 hypothetical protein [Pelomonas sp. P8]